MDSTVVRLLVILTVLMPRSASPNDGFYQGAGSTLMPVKSDAARVLRETLHIRPVAPPRCHGVLLNGKLVKSFGDFPSCEITGFANGPAIPFDRKKWGRQECPGLVTHWTVDATYHVEALASASDVRIGFPVPTWVLDYFSPDGRCGADLPGATGFKTWVDGRVVARSAVRELVLDRPPETRRWEEDDKTLGYVWTMSFEKGRRYTLRTTYDFGVSASAAFFEGDDYPAGAEPWFLSGARSSGARHLEYYLSPIRTWAGPPPASIRIQVDIPRHVPVVFFVPVKLRPTCVDVGAMFFDIEGEFPASDLDLAYPSSAEGLPTLATVDQWSAWRATVGLDAKLTCGLRDTLAKGAPELLAGKIRSTPCVPACRRKGE